MEKFVQIALVAFVETRGFVGGKFVAGTLAHNKFALGLFGTASSSLATSG